MSFCFSAGMENLNQTFQRVNPTDTKAKETAPRFVSIRELPKSEDAVVVDEAGVVRILEVSQTRLKVGLCMPRMQPLDSPLHFCSV